TSAVSTKLMPASRPAWMMRIDSSWSGSPQAPNIIVPRHRLETWTPVRPSGRYCMRLLSALGAGVLVVGDVAPPGDGAAGVVDLLDRQMGHEPVGSGPVPVVLAGL